MAKKVKKVPTVSVSIRLPQPAAAIYERIARDSEVSLPKVLLVVLLLAREKMPRGPGFP